MGKVVKKVVGGIFGGRKKAAAPAEQPTGPIITPLSQAPAVDPRRRRPLGQGLGATGTPTILSDKLGA